MIHQHYGQNETIQSLPQSKLRPPESANYNTTPAAVSIPNQHYHHLLLGNPHTRRSVITFSQLSPIQFPQDHQDFYRILYLCHLLIPHHQDLFARVHNFHTYPIGLQHQALFALRLHNLPTRPSSSSSKSQPGSSPPSKHPSPSPSPKHPHLKSLKAPKNHAHPPRAPRNVPPVAESTPQPASPTWTASTR